MDISDVVTVMNFGQKIAEGKPQEILLILKSLKLIWGGLMLKTIDLTTGYGPVEVLHEVKFGLQGLSHRHGFRSKWCWQVNIDKDDFGHTKALERLRPV